MKRDAKLSAVRVEVAGRMDQILALFKPGAKITVLVRRPDHPDGSQDFVMTNDEFGGAIAALEVRRAAEAETPASETVNGPGAVRRAENEASRQTEKL